MKGHRRRKVRRRARVFAGIVVIAFGCGAILAFSGRSPNPAIAMAGGFAFAVCASSLGEWLIHGLLYHRRVPGLEVVRRIHHHGHHFALFPPSRYSKTEGYEFMNVRSPLLPFRMADNRYDNLYTKLGQVALHFVGGIFLVLIPAFLRGGLSFFLSALATLTAISWLLAHVHGAIHRRRQRWIEGQGWFKWLDRHHFIHHVDLNANINFLLPLCDVVLGTRRASLTWDERQQHPQYARFEDLGRG